MAELAAGRGEPFAHLLTFVVVGAAPTGVELPFGATPAEKAKTSLEHLASTSSLATPADW